MSLMGLGPLLALDNIVAALALAPLCRDRAGFLRLIAWFAAVEAMAPVAGAILQPHLPIELVDRSAAAIVVTLGLTLLGLALTRRLPAGASSSAGLKAFDAAFPAERWAGGGWQTAVLAVVLGLDNLLAGTGMSFMAALACGAASAAAVAAACLLSRAVGRRLMPRARVVVCGVLLVVAGAMSWA